MSKPVVVDVHTHVYTRSYMDMLRRRTEIPRVHRSADGPEKVILLKEEAGHDGANSQGRPVGPQYWDRDEKIKFMDTHGIDVSVVSLANPWLDFLSPSEAITSAHELNIDLQEYCSTYTPSSSSSGFEPQTKHRLFAFGSLPLVPGIDQDEVIKSIEQVKNLSHLRGVVMGTKGVGNGLDDPALEPIWTAIEKAGLVVFVHPHYGIENAFGPLDNGHALALGLGFPFETTIAIARLILAGTLDRHPNLKLLLAHSAGALPALSSRLASCIIHDPAVKDRLDHDFRYYLGQMYYDAVAYGPEELALCERTIARADGWEGKDEQLEFMSRVTTRKDLSGLAPADEYPGAHRIMFGTDMPFFPPLPPADPSSRWRSVDENLDAIQSVHGWAEDERERVLGANAIDLFGLDL